MGGQSQPTTTTQIQKTELPAWVDAASQGNYQSAVDVSQRPYQSYQGERVAGLSLGEQAAPSIVGQGMETAAGLYGQSAGALGRAASYQPQQVQANGGFLNVNAPGGVADVGSFRAPSMIGSITAPKDVTAQRFTDTDLKGYLNPYTSNVVDTTLSGMRDNLALSAQKVDDSARGAGAWGSSRSGVQQAVLASQGAKDMAATEAGLRSAAYTDAAGRAMQDNTSALQAAIQNQNTGVTTNAQNLSAAQSNQGAMTANNALNAGIAQGNQSSALQTAQQRLAAETANQGAATAAADRSLTASTANASNSLAAANLGLNAGTALGSLAGSVTNDAGKNALLVSQMGANERSIRQATNDANAAAWQEQYDAPLTALNTRLAALGMSPYGKTTSGTTTQTGGTSSNGLMTGLGAASMFLPLLFGSDPKLKKNVEEVGETGIPGVKAYSYEYKKGFMGRDMPAHVAMPAGKQVGVMANEVEKVMPDAVHKFRTGDGKTMKAVDYGKVNMARRGFMGRAAA